MKKPNKNKYSKQTRRLKDNHSWKAPPGFFVVVLDRGAVSFNMPQTWQVTDSEPFTIRDKQPPDDKAGLQVSYWKFAAGIDWTGLPLAPMLLQSTQEERGDIRILTTSEVYTSNRTDIEMVWLEQRFIDPIEKRDALSRIAMGRGFDVTVLMTFSYWVDDEAECVPIWEEVLRSLQLGRTIADPLKGDTLH